MEWLSKLARNLKDFTQIVDGWQAFQLQWQLKHGLPPNVSHKALLERYVGWAYICASRNASAMASVPLRLYATRSTGEQKSRRNARKLSREEVKSLRGRTFGMKTASRLSNAEDVEEILEHPFLDLMQNINTQENEFEHREKTSIYQDCCGNAYWYVETNPVLGIPTALYLLPSQYVKVVPDRKTLIGGFLYGSDPNTAHLFKPEEVIHFRMPNPNSIYYGLGCIQAAVTAVDRYAAMDEYDASYSRNLGVPPFMVRYKVGKSTPEQRKEIESEWNRVIRSKNAGKIKVADNDWEIEKLATEPKEMGFAEGRKWTRLEIADAFGVPIALLDTENVNLANARTALFQYQKFSIAPRLIRMEQKLNERMMPYYDEPRLFVAFDDCVPEDEEFELKRHTEYLKNKVITVNEVRAHEGMDPVEWGDEPTPDPSPSISIGGNDNNKLPAKRLRVLKSHEGKALPPLDQNEKAFSDSLKDIFNFQKDEVLRLVSAGAIDFEWLEMDGQVMAIASVAKSHLVQAFNDGTEHGASLTKDLKLREDETEAFITNHAFQFAKEINRTTHVALKNALKEAVRNGDTPDKLASRIEEVFDGFEQADRAEMIARTELARAYTGGMLKQWRDSGMVSAKVWDASHGDACPICVELHGTEIPLKSRFARVGDTIAGVAITYEDLNGPPAHPNCLCTLQPVMKEEFVPGLNQE